MRTRHGMFLVMTCGASLTIASMILAAETAKIVTIEGASTTWHVEGTRGQPVTVDVPSSSITDVIAAKAATSGKDNAPGAMEAEVVSMDAKTNQIIVRTQTGQVIALAISPTSMQSLSIGAPLILEVPRMSPR